MLPASSRAPALTTANLNPAVVTAAYAVRGELVMKADAFREQLHAGGAKLPFDQIVACNIGNPHELGQQPLTFFRQVSCHTLPTDEHDFGLFQSDSGASATLN
jgi:alanine transaminase